MPTRVPPRLLFVCWKGSPSRPWAEVLEKHGYMVFVEETAIERAWRTAKERSIAAVIIDGQRKPTHGRQVGFNLRDTTLTRSIPIIWLNMTEEQRPYVRSEVQPDVTLECPCAVEHVLAALRQVGVPAIPATEAPPSPVSSTTG